MEMRYAKVLVAGGDEAFNRWQTLESQVEKPEENLEAFWNAFKKSFKQTTTHWLTLINILVISDKSQMSPQLT